MLDLAKVSATAFEPFLNRPFQMLSDSAQIELQLIRVSQSKHGGAQEGGRIPFSIEFKSGPGQPWPQGIYRLANETLGAMELFVVPLGTDANGCYYEAVFN
jgi:hypothetical protein